MKLIRKRQKEFGILNAFGAFSKAGNFAKATKATKLADIAKNSGCAEQAAKFAKDASKQRLIGNAKVAGTVAAGLGTVGAVGAEGQQSSGELSQQCTASTFARLDHIEPQPCTHWTQIFRAYIKSQACWRPSTGEAVEL